VIPSLRRDFNHRFQPGNYRRLLHTLDATVRTHVGFRVAESPCFLPSGLMEEMAAIGVELTERLVSDSAYLRASSSAIPEAFRAADETSRPHFMTVDFGIVRGADGGYSPRLVELQAFPSVFAYQFVLSELYRSVYDLDDSLDYFLGGHTETSFWKLYTRMLLGGFEPENVVLVDVHPQQQKTLPDFLVTADRVGLEIVDIVDLIPEARPGRPTKLYYAKGKRMVPIHRIYNRAIVDEIVRAQIHVPFDYREPLDVEWAGHPNWYFHISKFSLPYLDHPAVPPAIFLSDWFAGKGRDRLPSDRESLILKPLFSFAGKGIQFAPSDADLAAIPPRQRHEYLLQERVHFEPVIQTPDGPTQAEIRILYLWPDDHDLEPVLSLVRLGRGMMMGVDHNRDKEWVGASAAFFPPPGD
jgi:hypothetical protein